MKSFFNDVFSIGVSKTLMMVFGFTTTIIIARVLGPEKNGIIAALLVYPSLFMSFGSLGIRQSTTYFLGKGIFSEDEIKRAITQIWLFTTVFSIAVCFVLMRYFSKSGENLWLVLLALMPIPFTLFNTYNSGIFLGKNEISSFNKINWIPTALIFVVTLVLVLWLSFGISGYLIAMISGPTFISLVLFFKNKFIKAFGFDFNWVIIKRMLSLGLVYAFALLVINLNYRMDVILLDKLSTAFETGIYSKGVSITEYLWQIPMLLSTVVFARSAVSKDDIGFSIKVTQLLRLSFLVIGLGALVLFLLSEQIIILMFGDAFINSVLVLNILLPGVLLLTIFKVINMDLSGKGKPWVSLKAMFPALLINVVLNFVLIPKQGASGAALASTVSYTLAAILFVHFYSKEVNLPVKEILRYKASDFQPIVQLLKKLKR
ncbi:polysaccharide biosynthesis C-terminal domain-containing protein [Winogradskyella sp. DF17]|uniref:Polysaccharide biosynthesis C-terminal domain-containing protein n=1 Tax=Winogradskyella pelagia TaxID=2819984 RepID=A0ABS3T1M8_9FLAO|nr:polysaccharide biosynthesis C-terminal domain-containing protein [Winogradskyella sp. DF17]MBO3115781.1 polysaccharide biosynthesis C-terminal domain-containing protein [Winogradskyella sp. DF17]